MTDIKKDVVHAGATVVFTPDGGSATYLGHTIGDAELGPTRELFTLDNVNQILGNADAFITHEDFEVVFTLACATYENVAVAWDGTASQDTDNYVKGGGLHGKPTVGKLEIHCQGPYDATLTDYVQRLITVHQAYLSEPARYLLNRKGATYLTLKFSAMPDTTQAAGEMLYEVMDDVSEAYVLTTGLAA